ncbi:MULTISPECIES: RNA ligase family protein [unclassified Serratia (in: enterobacteria)]|uniref:RNA ligase family protein n=1 Tax=unclassified Serratia (in: enterobacteria) TaxID=2647522 RepID=UPI00050363F5|nr:MULTISPECIES: RNA ligase family protein [unclassified Serratia (in: enterobacteria)]KFK92664.1 2'-5' RNA ligase [Serratia sp. Ag2]KFL00678.1 2'-5' RNA ligase [Serratia sp. Ag1]
MDVQRKYGRTYHYPFSPGTTSDDRINKKYWQDMQLINLLIHTEKLDGENNCLNQYGVFARSHAAPTVSPWTRQIRQRWQQIKNDLGDIELFGENVYATHSIEYRALEQDFYLFAVRCKDIWLSWEEVRFYAALFDFACVPELALSDQRQTEAEYRASIIEQAGEAGCFAPHDVHTGLPCSMEGIVTRNAAEFPVAQFSHNVFKYVRKNHVKTDRHWRVNWQRARMAHEYHQEEGHVVPK